MKQIRTDLAMESFDGAGGESLPGVQVSHWDVADVRMTEVLITDPDAAQSLGKACGAYLTMECGLLRERAPEARLAVAALLGEELGRMIQPDDSAPVLVVGLGNRFITPDSLGPRAVDRTLVTRHMAECGFASENLRSVCAIAPGVLGITESRRRKWSRASSKSSGRGPSSASTASRRGIPPASAARSSSPTPASSPARAWATTAGR